MGRKRKSVGEEMLLKLRGEPNTILPNLQEQNHANVEPETEETTYPQSSDTILPNLQEQNHANVELETEETTYPLSSDDTQIENKKQKTCGQLLVKIIDTKTKEITIRKMAANEVWNLEKNLKVIVELNGNGQGNDNGANLLVRFLGKISKNATLCPITLKSWTKMPNDKISQQWKYIEDNFMFDYAAGCKWAMSNLGEKWRSHKYKLRCRYFYPNKTKQHVLDNPPPGINSSDWTIFVDHYFDEDMKKICHQNSLNRGKLKVPHAGGSRSNARKGRQMAEKLGRPICRGEIVLSNILKDDGNCTTEERKKLAEEISEFLPQDQLHATTTLGLSSMILASPNDTIGKVFGAEHSGRVRAMGIGVCPSNAFGLHSQLNQSRPSSLVSNAIEECVGDLVKKVDTLQEKLNGYDEMKVQLVETQTQLRETKEQLFRNQLMMDGLIKLVQAKFGLDSGFASRDASPS